jgi:predicted DCC family thiol-disulfide oxidoreductase YuxK
VCELVQAAVNVQTLRRALTRTYFTIDGRSLALCRIALATVLIVDLLRRVPWLRDLYSNAGLLPNHTVLWRPPQPRIFSVFFMASLADEAAVWFAIALFCFACLLVGWRTRLFHLLSFAMTTSLHDRILVAENWGTVTLAILMLWTAFLPLGRRFSVDALLASLRAGKGEQPDDIAERRLPAPDERPAVSLAVLAVLLQLAVIYWFNYAPKTGATWRTGSAVHYVLWQERIVTWLGVWSRQHLPFAVTKGLTYGTLLVEAFAPVLVLTPIFWRQARVLAIVVLTALHSGIALVVNLGIFSATMIAFLPMLFDTAHWDWLSSRLRRRGSRLLAFYDADCGVCFQVVRVLVRLDVHQRVRWISNRDSAALPADLDPAALLHARASRAAPLLDATILVVDAESGRRWTRSDAFARLFAAMPSGRLWGWVLLVPGLRAVAGRAYDAFARHRTSISTALGLAACAMPQPRRASSAAAEDVALASPLRARFLGLLPTLREAGVAFALVVLGADLSVSNASVPRALRWDRRPKWMADAITYPHIAEAWGLFSPDAPLSDEMVVVDAVTSDGRRVDPYNEAGSRVHTLPVEDIPVRLGHDSMFCDYTLRIPSAGAYHQALREWILRYPERTGHSRDSIVAFEARKLEHDSPPPGESSPSNVRTQVFLKWP